MIKHKKLNKHIAIASAFLLTISSIPFKSFAKESTNNIDTENTIIGAIAEPYVPDYIQIDKNKKPILDENGNFIFINEEGDTIDSEILKDYTITANEDGEIISEIVKSDQPTTFSTRTTSAKAVNLGTKNIMIRSSKSTSSAIVDKIKPNEVVTVLKIDDSAWYKVSYKNSSGITKVGYSVKDGLVLVEEKSDIEVKNISGANVNIRTTGSKTGTIIGSLPANKVAYAVNRENGWIRIIYNDICGWVSESLVKFTNPKTSKSTNLTSGDLVLSVYGKDKSTSVNIKTSSQMLDSNGRHFYCMDPEKFSPNGHPYYRGEQLDNGAYRILKNGYPYKSITGDNTTDRVITQIAFWAYVDKGSVDIDNLVMLKNETANSSLLNHVKTLYNKSTSDSSTQDVSVKFSKQQLTATFKNNVFETDFITLIGEGDIKSATTTLSFTSKSSDSKLNGIKIVGEDNKELSSISIGQKFKILIPSSISAGDIIIKGTSVIEREGAIFYTSGLAGVQDAAILETIKEEKDLTNELNVSWKGIGSLDITKTDSETKSKLAGAQYSITDSNGQVVQTLTTNDDGYAKSKELPFGTYKIQEVKAPTGYVIDNTVHTVDINTTSTISLNYTNNPIKGSVSIKKVDADNPNKVLQGAEFTLFSKDNKEIAKAVTNSNGIATFSNIKYGEYIVKETKAPTGYELDSKTTHNVTVSENGKVYTVTATNKLITGSVSIKKVDSDDENKVLEGAEFTLYTDSHKEVAKAITDANGVASFKNLTVGKYYIKETKAPTGYVISDDIKNFEVTSAERSFSFTIQNTKIVGELDFSKTDVSTGDIIEGATIEITGLDKTNDHINFSFISSKDGNKFKLPVGKYEFKETIAPNGYVLSTEVGTFEIKTNGEIVKAELKNKPILGSLKVLKVDDEDNSKLTGAEFSLTDETGKEISKLEVDKDGIALFENLRAGNYKLTETKAPTGYQLLDSPISVTISKDGEVIELIVKNSKTAGELEFSKIDVSTGDLLEGALIEINGLDDNNKHIQISFISSKEGNKFKLPLGKYEFKETAAPEGYALNTEVGTFEIKSNGEVVKAKLENRPIRGSLKVFKVDSKTEKALTGAEFTLYDEKGNEISKLEVDKDGIALFDNLQLGKYSLKETKAPTNYQIADKAFDVEITQDGEVVELTVKNDAKLAQTGGDYTFNQLIFTGSALLAVGFILLQRNRGGKINE